jgi:hypothetical protein
MFGFQLASWWFFPWKTTQGAKYNIGILGQVDPWLLPAGGGSFGGLGRLA